MKTPEELEIIKAELKQKYKKVNQITIPCDEDDLSKHFTIFVKKPDQTTRSIVSKLVDKDWYRAIEAAVKNIWIGGDDLNEVLKFDDALASLDNPITELLKVEKAELKKNV
jgi:hypothetical protein